MSSTQQATDTPTHRLSRRRAWMWIGAVVAVLAIAAGVTVVMWPGPAVPTFTMHGFLSTRILNTDGSVACDGTGSDQGSLARISGGDQVAVSDGQDSLATGSLAAGQEQDNLCLFAVTVPGVPVGHASYALTVDSCQPLVVSQQEARGALEVQFPTGC
jgi:hypothetical protein